MRIPILVLLAACPAWTAARAQQAPRPTPPQPVARQATTVPPLRVGSRVRVRVHMPRERRFADSDLITGVLARLDDDSLIVHTERDPVRLSRGRVRSLDVYDRDAADARFASAALGVGHGGLAGAFVGALLVASDRDFCGSGDAFCIPLVVYGASLGAAPGMLVGGTIGLLGAPSGWRRVHVAAGTRVGFKATPAGVALSLRF